MSDPKRYSYLVCYNFGYGTGRSVVTTDLSEIKNEEDIERLESVISKNQDLSVVVVTNVIPLPIKGE